MNKPCPKCKGELEYRDSTDFTKPFDYLEQFFMLEIAGVFSVFLVAFFVSFWEKEIAFVISLVAVVWSSLIISKSRQIWHCKKCNSHFLGGQLKPFSLEKWDVE
jgi:uncharacterized protein YbaR (Trm112 family)